MSTIMSTYTQDQLAKYLDHIGYAPPEACGTAAFPLGILSDLQRHHMARVPFESLGLHYSNHRLLSLDAEDLYRKVIEDGRGGYCMELNTFFAAVLRSMGFTVLSVGGRVKSPVMGYKGWDHMANIVSIDNKRYLVDVGFGVDTPPQPVPLEHGHTFSLVSPARGRLQYKKLDEHTDPAQRVWVFQSQGNELAEWTDRYAFVEIEFFPADFEVMNLRTSTTPQSFFVQSVVCLTTILSKEKTLVEGYLILYKDMVKRRIGENTQIVEELRTEDDRVMALEKYFVIVLKPAERKGIRGLASELRG